VTPTNGTTWAITDGKRRFGYGTGDLRWRFWTTPARNCKARNLEKDFLWQVPYAMDFFASPLVHNGKLYVPVLTAGC
jgi:hypothetical protein